MGIEDKIKWDDLTFCSVPFPGDKGLLKKPIDCGDGIIIVRPFSEIERTHGISDFDGTLANLRTEWQDYMSEVMIDYMMKNTDINKDEAKKVVFRLIEVTTGIPTNSQMKLLVDIKNDLGYKDETDPVSLKNIYLGRFNPVVEEKYSQLEKGQINVEKLRIPGAYELLKKLEEKINFVIGSGTNIDAILRSVKLLGYGDIFPPEKIKAAGSLGKYDCVKEWLFNELIKKQDGEKLVGWGDGFPELIYITNAGGLGLGVVSGELSKHQKDGYFLTEKKEAHLIQRGGAHIIIRDPYKNPEKTAEIILNGYKKYHTTS